MKKTKVVMTKVPASSQYKAGDVIEATGAQLDTLSEGGHEYITAAEHEANEATQKLNDRIVKAREFGIDGAIAKAIARGAFLPKEDTSQVREKALKMEEFSDGMGVEHIEGIKAKGAAVEDPLKARSTSGNEGGEGQLIRAGESSFRDTFKEYITASEPFRKTLKQGGIVGACGSSESESQKKAMADATTLARSKGAVVSRLSDMIKAGADYKWEDVVKAADYVDPAAGNLLGQLNSDIMLNFNFGHLENQLAPLDDITTDISDTPVRFMNRASSRYILVPGFQSKTNTNAWVDGTGGTVDVDIIMNHHIGVPLAWNNNIIGATTRNFPSEFRTPQMYSIGQAIIYYLINNIVNGNNRYSNDGVTVNVVKPAAKFDGVNAGTPFKLKAASGGATSLRTFTSDLPAAMDLAQFPGGEEDEMEEVLRWAWVHTMVYAAATADSNLILNQTLQRLGNKINPNAMVTGKINRLGNISFRKSQLITDQNVLVADPTNASSQVVSTGDFTKATMMGACGTRSGLMFTSRLPLDYTKLLGVEGGFAVEVATTPKLGIKMAIVKHLDHNYEIAKMRGSIMFGTSIGDERQIGQCVNQ